MDNMVCCNILNSLNLGIVYHEILFDKKDNPTDFKFSLCNSAFTKITGTKGEKFINKLISQISDEGYFFKPLLDAYQVLFATREFDKYKTTIKVEDSWYYVQVFSVDSSHFVLMIGDVSSEMAYVKQFLFNAFKVIKSPLFTIHPKTGHILFATDAACSFFGYSFETMLSKKIFDVIERSTTVINPLIEKNHKIDSIQNVLQTTMEKGMGKGCFATKTQSGEIREITFQLTFIDLYEDQIIVAAILDQTDNLRMARNLKERELHYRTLFEEAPVGYQALDAEGNILSVNSQWQNILGYKKEEVIGKPFFDFVASENSDMVRLFHKRCKHRQDIDVKFKMMTKSKKIIHVHVTGKVKYDEKGIFSYCQCMIFDITRNVEAKEKEKQLQNSKNEFLAVISHEVRTPLTTIMGLTELLKNSQLEIFQLDYLNQITSASNSLLGIINDMLDVAKYESGKQSIENLPFRFDEFIQNIVTTCKMRTEVNGNKFRYDFDENIPDYLIGDSLRLGQILNNILTNSIKFTHKGKITFTTRLIGRTIDSADVQFVIRDTGIGMTQDQLEKLFVPFEQADTSFARKYGGSGLGMAISKQLIDLMGGNIRAESIYNEGTIFIIDLTFPISKCDKDNLYASCTIATKEKLAGVSKKHVLVVEDHKINQKIICDILKHYDLNVDVASNGLEAVRKAKNYYYDLILMDIQMPKMDGMSAARQIRSMKDEKSKNTPILAMTAHAMKEQYKKSLNSGMNGHLTKPINIAELEENLIKYLTHSNIEIDSTCIIDDCSNEEHIDVRMGLLRFHNDADAYKSSLKDFMDYKSADKKLIKMLNKNDTEKASRFLHSIKGIAGNLSMVRLMKSSDELKKHLSNSANPFLDEDVTGFSDCLKTVIGLIESKEVFKRIDSVMVYHTKR